MSHWVVQPELAPETTFDTSPTGYSNDEISLGWIKHFEKHTRMGLLEKSDFLFWMAMDPTLQR
jgi:hypothetical protein